MASDFQLLLSPTPSNGCNCVPVFVEDWKDPKDSKKKNWKRVRIIGRHWDKRSSEREGQTYHGLEVGRSWWTCDAYPLPEELRNPLAP
jgi:hypothetical protein